MKEDKIDYRTKSGKRVFLCGLMRTGKHFVMHLLRELLGVWKVGGPYQDEDFHVFTYDIGPRLIVDIDKCMKRFGEDSTGVIFTQREWGHLFDSQRLRDPHLVRLKDPYLDGHHDKWLADQQAQKELLDQFLSDHPGLHVEHLWSPEEAKDWREVDRVIRAFFPDVEREEVERLHLKKFRPIVRGKAMEY